MSDIVWRSIATTRNTVNDVLGFRFRAEGKSHEATPIHHAFRQRGCGADAARS
jgi:hypothetical protein